MARIAFYVSETEFKEIAKLAGDVPLSKWCRKRVMERMAVPVDEQGGRKCLCGDAWEEHWHGGRCYKEGCKCDKFEEG